MKTAIEPCSRCGSVLHDLMACGVGRNWGKKPLKKGGPLMRLAHVGHTRTYGDTMRTLIALKWAAKCGLLVAKTTPVPDFIDLRDGRDFLVEDKQYDLVILHFIFRGGFSIPTNRKRNTQLAHSPLSGWGEWRKRLTMTGAQVIIAFGGFAEVGGTYLCNLDGYTVAHREGDIVYKEGEKVNLADSGDQVNKFWVFKKV